VIGLRVLSAAAFVVAALCFAAPALAGGVTVGGTIDGSDQTFTHLANHSCVASSGQTTHYDAIQFYTVGNRPTTISVSMTPGAFVGAVFLYQGGFLPDLPIVNCYDTASSVVGSVSGGTLTFNTNMGALPDPFTFEPWTLVVTTATAASAGGSYSATISSSATGVALPSTTTITNVTPEPSDTGQPVEVDWFVADQFGGTTAPSGTVTVTTDGSESCSAAVAVGHCSIVFTSPGDRQLTASYSGDSTFQSSEDFTDHTVNGTAATTAVSLARSDPTPTKASAVHYSLAFAGPVTGVDASAFTLVTSGLSGATITNVAGSGTDWTVTVATGTGSGLLSLDLTDTSSISPAISNAPFAGETYVIDKTAPTVTAPANITTEATSAAGATVTYSTATAVDTVDGPLPAVCTPASGSVFPLGPTTVSCSATDTAGNTGTASFTVTVLDTTAPAVTVPTSIVAEATSPAGAAVTFTATATDTVDGPLPVTCTRAPGSTFPLGPTTVTCSAVDTAGNTGMSSFTVTVQDTTAPVYGSAPNVTADATSPAGAVVTYSTPSASDAVGVVSNSCVPASGASFPIGTTTVTCHAADAAGNIATTTFTVTVLSAASQVGNLLEQVQAISPPPALGASLSNKLLSVEASLQAGNVADACGTLQGFINEVQAQSGKKLSASAAAALIAEATQIRAVLGC
jgi:HYR domain/Bacterial Ig-like domain (group 3)/FIMAH domain